MNLKVIICYFLLICAAHAGDGGFAITVEPNDAEIYIDGQLKTNSSPATLTLPEGKHQVEVKKAGMRSENFEIVIPVESVIVKKVTLTPVKPPITDLTTFLKPEQGKFETDAEFLARRTQLLAEFNQGVQSHDARFQVGTAKLDHQNYDLKNGSFPVKLEVLAWAKPFFTPTQLYIAGLRDEAQNLWQEGEQKQLFAYLKLGKHAAEIEKMVLMGLNKEWTLNEVTGHLFVAFPNSLDKLFNKLGKTYKINFPYVYPHVTTTSSVEETFVALLNAQANVIVLPRRLTETEISAFEKKFEFEPTEIHLAMKMYAAYVHKSNPLDIMTIPGLDAMFSSTRNCGLTEPLHTWGQASRLLEGTFDATYRVFKNVTKNVLGMKKTWEELPIVLFIPKNNPLTEQFVKDVVLCGGQLKAEVRRYDDKNPLNVIAANTQNIAIDAVQEIGELPVKMLKIYNSRENGTFSSGGIEATSENALKNKYLLTQNIWLYVNVPPKAKLHPMTREMLRTIFSRTGRDILEGLEFISLPESEYPEQLTKF